MKIKTISYFFVALLLTGLIYAEEFEVSFYIESLGNDGSYISWNFYTNNTTEFILESINDDSIYIVEGSWNIDNGNIVVTFSDLSQIDPYFIYRLFVNRSYKNEQTELNIISSDSLSFPFSNRYLIIAGITCSIFKNTRQIEEVNSKALDVQSWKQPNNTNHYKFDHALYFPDSFLYALYHSENELTLMKLLNGRQIRIDNSKEWTTEWTETNLEIQISYNRLGVIDEITYKNGTGRSNYIYEYDGGLIKSINKYNLDNKISELLYYYSDEGQLLYSIYKNIETGIEMKYEYLFDESNYCFSLIRKNPSDEVIDKYIYIPRENYTVHKILHLDGSDNLLEQTRYIYNDGKIQRISGENSESFIFVYSDESSIVEIINNSDSKKYTLNEKY